MENFDDEDDFWEIMEENDSLERLFIENGSIQSFLRRENVVCVRGSTADDADQDAFLNIGTDIDGCVLELKSWNAVNLPIRHLTICSTNPRKIWSLLKKHIDLTKYSENQLSAVKQSLGFQLFYENGWEGWVGVLPRVDIRFNNVTEEVYRAMCNQYFEQIRAKFQRRLFCRKDELYRTLAKNDMNNVQKMFILPDDSSLILNEFQKSIEEAEIEHGFHVIKFCFRFGDKAKNGISLVDFRMEDLKRVTVHCAADISSDVMDLMWSRAGVQDIVGERGVLNSCLSFRDCVCFQSNLDSKVMDISKDLRQVVNQPEKLQFVQLYVDTPHRRPNTRFHPVSGCIAGGMVFPKRTADAFLRDANSYISTVESNFGLIQSASCRIEFVCEIEAKNHIQAIDCLCLDNLRRLLRTRPMLAPFSKNTTKLIQGLGMMITKSLKTLLGQYSSTGNIEAIWKAFQLELAAEKVLWGYPLCFRSHPYSVGLGPGRLNPSYSLTDELGFLALSGWSSCMVTEESIPPCEIWTSAPSVCDKIKRTVGMHDILSSGPCVLGRRLVHALIRDLYVASKVVVGYNEVRRDLNSDVTANLKVQGCISIEEIVTLLLRKQRVPAEMVFGVLLKLLEGSKHELKTILEAGIVEVGLKHFPAIQNYDKHGHASLTWNWRSGYWKIVGMSKGIYPSSFDLSGRVKAQLDARGLVYASRLRTANFPWMDTCVRKLLNEKLDENKLVHTLCFVSCVGLLMNGWYVNYNNLNELLLEMPISQVQLKQLEIQSQLLLANFNKFKLFRLHHTIPNRLAIDSKPTSVQKPESENESASVLESIEDAINPPKIGDETDETTAAIVKSQPVCLPLSNKRKWDASELEILHDVSSKNLKGLNEKYEAFKSQCMVAKVPFRTKKAFQLKLNRL